MGKVVDEEASNGKIVYKTVPMCVLDIADSGEKNLEEIGVLLGVSKERIRQIEMKAMRKVRHHLRVIGAISPEEDHSYLRLLSP